MMGRHSIRDDTEEFQKIVVHDHSGTSQHRASVSSLVMVSFVVALVSLFVGWLLFGVPSWVATFLAIKALRETEDTETGAVASVALALGVLGSLLGAIVALAVLRG